MQEGTATQTQTEEPGIELAALSSAGHSIPVEPSAASDTSVPDENFQPRLLHSDSYDVENAEICTAVIRNIPRKPLSDKIHLKVRDIKSNKIARRTFKAMLVFGIITLLYQFTSLGPQFQGAFAAASSLKVQIKGETDARQSNALEFLSICADRKTKNLPLGRDCLKYLSMTPKAPADIDNWVMDPPAANASDSILTARTIESSLVPQLNESLPITPLKVEQLPSRSVLYLVCFISISSTLAMFYILQYGFNGLWGILSWLDNHSRLLFRTEIFKKMREGLEPQIGMGTSRLIKLTLIVWLLLNIYAGVILWNSQYLLESWSATSDFLETCKMQQALDLPLGDDCLKYMIKELKPRPASTGADTIALVIVILCTGTSLIAIILAVRVALRLTPIHLPWSSESRIRFRVGRVAVNH